MKRTIIIYALCFLSMSIYSQVELGGTTSFTEVEADGTLEFHGEATVWNDYVVPLAGAKVKGAAGDEPTFAQFKDAIWAYEFDTNKDDEMFLSIQMPHTWDGTAIFPHIHWSPSDVGSGDVMWGMDYTWVNYGGTFGDAVTVTVNQAADGAFKHQIARFGPENGISPGETQNAISTVLVIRLYREGTNDADTYGSGAFGLSFDIHYREDTAGSRQEYIK